MYCGYIRSVLSVLGGVGCMLSEVECNMGGFVCLFGVHLVFLSLGRVSFRCDG